jgi:hypothetical protein
MMSEKRSAQYIAPILTPVQTVGSITSGVLQYIGTINTITNPITVGNIADIGTLGTLINGQVTATITSGILQYIGTIGTVQFGNVTVSAIAAIATIGTLQFGNVTVSAISGIATLGALATIGTLQSGFVTHQQMYGQVNILTGQVVVSGTAVASTIVMGTMQDMVVDIVYGTVISGSIQTSVLGVEPQSNIKTSTVVGGDYYGGTVVVGQRLVALGPLGLKVAVIVNTGANSTVQAVYISAVPSTSM